jgi:hypothetical protein
MSTKTYVAIALLAAITFLIGGFILSATAPVAYADSSHTQTNTHTNTHVNQNCNTIGNNSGTGTTCAVASG